MRHHFLYTCLLALCCSMASVVGSDRIKSKIYKPVESSFYCFRRMNATHQIGCNTKESGNVGVVHVIRNEPDISYVLKEGKHWPYMAAISPELYNSKTLIRFKEASDRISGVLVLNSDNETRVSQFSPDKSCPNQYLDLYANNTEFRHCQKQQWNPSNDGLTEGLMFMDWPFPIFLVNNDSQISEILQCFDRFGGPDWPLCAIELTAPMSAAKDSTTCLRRTYLSRQSYSMSQAQFCDPLGGWNIFSTLFETSRNETIENKSLVVLASRLDSFSMFDNISPGADSAIISVITLLSVADTLSQHKEAIKTKGKNKNIFFALFDGEAFDYIGSSDVAYDMRLGKFPVDPSSDRDMAQIKLSQVSHFIELSQLTPHAVTEGKHKLWVHRDGATKPDETTKKLIDSLISNGGQTPTVEVARTEEDRPLPPSSLHTFLKDDRSLTGVVIANHQKEYTNKYYNSIFDDINNVNQSSKYSQNLADISDLVSKTVYQLLADQPKEAIKPNQTLIEKLIHCYLVDSSCDFFKYITGGTVKRLPQQLFSYVGVYHSQTASTFYRDITSLVLSYVTGDRTNITTKDDCNQLSKDSQKFNYNWMTDNSTSTSGVCIKSLVFRRQTISPAFRNYFTEGTIIGPNSYSTWTESQWQSVSARMFVMPSALQRWLTLITGILVLILSFVVVYFIDKNSSSIFLANEEFVVQQAVAVGC